MMCISVLYKTCQDLYTNHPLASEPVDPAGIVHVMVLVLPDGGNERFFALSQNRAAATPRYQLCSWSGEDPMPFTCA